MKRLARQSGMSLVELLVGIAIAAITLPLILNLLIEPLLSQLRTSALSEAEGNTRLLAMKARESTTVEWDPDSRELRFDGAAYPVPEGCNISAGESDEGGLVVTCISGSHSSAHTSERPLVSNDPCGGSDLIAVTLPDAVEAKCRASLNR